MTTPFDDVTLAVRQPFGLTVSSRRPVDVVALASGHESRNARTANALRRFTIPVGPRPVAEIRAILTFFEARGGPLKAFRFRDPLEHSTALGGGAPTAQDVALGTGDGATTAFQLATPSGRAITKPEAGTVLVSVDDVALAPADFAVDPLTGIVTLDAAPGQGAMVKAGCRYDLAVRFEASALTVARTTAETAEMEDLVLLEVPA
ncbi:MULTISPECIES: TIGR02217 family protein [unclassified Roseitalea]|uniref:phage distal tail protein, Rcc01695 family n=1 Tax=unclassified Roseitalea TaxID=2639107 RepID=UPI00273E3E2B|nr:MULTISPECIES: TIGR02217 family protein [unclassified Roseitalea]